MWWCFISKIEERKKKKVRSFSHAVKPWNRKPSHSSDHTPCLSKFWCTVKFQDSEPIRSSDLRWMFPVQIGNPFLFSLHLLCVLFELRNPCTTLKPINTHSCNPRTDLSPIQIQNSLRSFESFVLCCCARVLHRSLILSSCSLKHLQRRQGGLRFKHGDGVRWVIGKTIAVLMLSYN